MVDDATLLDPKGKATRSGVLNALGVQYAGSNGTMTGVLGSDSARPRWDSGAEERILSSELLLWTLMVLVVLSTISGHT